MRLVEKYFLYMAVYNLHMRNDGPVNRTAVFSAQRVPSVLAATAIPDTCYSTAVRSFIL